MNILVLSILDEVSQSTRSYGSENLLPVILFFLAIVILFVVGYFLIEAFSAKQKGQKKQATVKKNIAAELGLNAQEIAFLEILKQQARLPVIDFFFVDPILLESVINTLYSEMSTTQLKLAQSIMLKLFDIESIEQPVAS